jgi:hypothetical protein
VNRILDMTFNDRRNRRRECARDMRRNIRTKEKSLNLSRKSLFNSISIAYQTKISLATDLVHRIPKAFSNLPTQRKLDLILRDVLQRWQHRILHLRLDGHLDNTGRVLRELVRDELQDLLLTRKVCRLFVDTDFLETLI